MTGMQPGKGRSLAQVPRNMTSGTSERLSASSVSAGTHWPAWDSFAAGDTVLKMVGSTAPSDILKFLVKRAKLLRRSDMQIDVMENGVRF